MLTRYGSCCSPWWKNGRRKQAIDAFDQFFVSNLILCDQTDVTWAQTVRIVKQGLI